MCHKGDALGTVCDRVTATGDLVRDEQVRTPPAVPLERQLEPRKGPLSRNRTSGRDREVATAISNHAIAGAQARSTH